MRMRQERFYITKLGSENQGTDISGQVLCVINPGSFISETELRSMFLINESIDYYDPETIRQHRYIYENINKIIKRLVELKYIRSETF